MKPLSDSKTRLAATLEPARREALAAAMFASTLAAATAATTISTVTVIGGDDVARRLSRGSRAEWREEPTAGLNPSLTAVLTEWATELPYVLYLPADLPLLTHLDLDALVSEAAPGRLVVAPDRWRRGTNAMLLPAGQAFAPSLGEDSLDRHVAEAQQRGLDVRVVERDGLAFDVDTAADLEFLLEQRSGWWDTATALVQGAMSSQPRSGGG